MSYLSLGDNENEDDFAPSFGGMSSNLGSLFGMNTQMDNRAGSNQSLTYTAPKPPRPERPQQDREEKKTSSGAGVAAAVAISAYKYVGNQYKLQGKLGMALLSNYSERDFKILMYVSKQQPVTTAKVSSDFQFSVQQNNYASFHDDQRQPWSILFPTYDQLVTFTKQVCLAKYHCQTENRVLTQDLILGETDSLPLAVGDSVEAKYTGWLVSSEDGALGAVFDSNHNNDKFFRFKTGKGKVIKGWEEGMLGMKKGGKRFLIIPPSLAYGSKAVGNRVPPNSTLAFEVDIVRTKHQSSATASEATGPALPEVKQTEQSETLNLPHDSAVVSDVPQETIKSRAASFNEQATGHPTNTGKASLVSRMAKVGHPMLPVKPYIQQETVMAPLAVASSPETHHPPSHCDSRSTYSNSPGLAIQSNAAVMPNVEYQRIAYSPQANPAVQLSMMQHAMPGMSNIQPTGVIGVNDISRQGFHSPFPQQYASTGMDVLPVILAESQNSNYRLKALMEKVEEVSEKVTKLKSESSGYNKPSEMMDAAQISFNIQRILQENERVKKQIVDRDVLVQQQTDKIADLLQQNHKMVEDSHERMAKRNVSFNERIGLTQEKTLKLEQEKLELTNKLSEATSKICELQLSLANTSERANALEKIAKSSACQTENELRIQRLESELTSAQDKLASAFQEKSESDKVKLNLGTEVQKLQGEIRLLKQKHDEEISATQTKYQSQQSDSAHRQEQLEENWKDKCKNAVAKVSKAAEERIKDVEGEKEELGKKLEAFQLKMIQMRKMYQDKSNSEEHLKKQLADMETVKHKYENLRKQAIAMRQQYENKISELEQSNQGQGDAPDAQIKSVMNKVFQDVRTQIVQDQEYSGKEVLARLLSVIKSATLSLLTSKQSDEEEDVEEESDDDEQSDEEASRLTEEDANNSTAGETVDAAHISESSDPVLRTPTESHADSNEVSNDGNISNGDDCNVEEKTEVEEKEEDHSKGVIPGESQENVVKNTEEQNEDNKASLLEEKISNIVPKNDDVDKEDDSSLEDSKPTPPPLFDDDDDNEDESDWLS